MRFEHFENRLSKMYAHFGKWARRQGYMCYRLYDDDMPEFPFSIDCYKNTLYVSEYKRDHKMTPEEHTIWVDECLKVMSKVLDIPIEKIFVKERRPQKGEAQYEKLNETGNRFMVDENGLSFLVNLVDYLDTGLFLDHRNTRQMVKEAAEGKRMLNLFAYTGSFSVYAAAGGALSTTTVDLSKTYIAWAMDNMKINGFVGRSHRYLQEDVKEWLPKVSANSYDLIVLDPPTFSNSKRMNDVLDIQRDHVELLKQCLRILTPNGKLFFSTNFRRFKLDESTLEFSSIKNISHLTVPNDFRDKKIHQCWLITK